MNCAQNATARTHATQGRGPRILVSIEYPVEALALESLLRSERYHDVRVTTDVREVAPMYLRWPFDLLILDMHSKLMDSATVMQNLTRPISTSELKVLALLNPGAEQERLAALSAGALDILSRPLNHENVLPRIRDALAAGPASIPSF